MKVARSTTYTTNRNETEMVCTITYTFDVRPFAHASFPDDHWEVCDEDGICLGHYPTEQAARDSIDNGEHDWVLTED